MRLGINIDHVATIRNARGGNHPNPLEIAIIAEKCNVDNITAHLREDRRHVNENDIKSLLSKLKIPLNFEMAATSEMINFAVENLPYACCIVPEKREEITTEGGLNLKSNKEIVDCINKLKDAGRYNWKTRFGPSCSTRNFSKDSQGYYLLGVEGNILDKVNY